MALHVIVGKGPVGTTTAAELVAKGHEVRVLSRSGGASTDAVEHRQVDATDADALADAARGAAALYNAVNPAYHRWPTDWPPVAAALLTAAERTGAVLVTMSNLYGYGRPSGPDDPGHPAGGHRRQGARPDRGCGRTRSPRTRPAGCGSPRRGRRTSSARRCPPTAVAPEPAAADPAEGPPGLGDRRPRRPAQLGVPARRRRDAGDAGHRRAGARPGLARAEQPAAVASARPSATSPRRMRAAAGRR